MGQFSALQDETDCLGHEWVDQVPGHQTVWAHIVSGPARQDGPRLGCDSRSCRMLEPRGQRGAITRRPRSGVAQRRQLHHQSRGRVHLRHGSLLARRCAPPHHQRTPDEQDGVPSTGRLRRPVGAVERRARQPASSSNRPSNSATLWATLRSRCTDGYRATRWGPSWRASRPR